MEGMVVWFTGLPQAGKTSLAHAACARLGPRSILLDEDELHDAIACAPSLDDPAFTATTGGIAALLARQGFLVLVAASARRRSDRERARRLAPRFLEVHVATPLDGGPGREGHGSSFESAAGVGPEPERGYEPPLAPDVISRGGRDQLALDRLIDRIEEAARA